jgi:hypothetical protein
MVTPRLVGLATALAVLSACGETPTTPAPPPQGIEAPLLQRVRRR